MKRNLTQTNSDATDGQSNAPVKQMRYRKTKRETLSAAVEGQLRFAILQGRYKPGDRLTIPDLAEELGTSATPIREALMKLVADRILDVMPGQFRIPVLTEEQYLEICHIRKELEGMAGELAAQRATPAVLKEIKAEGLRYIEALSKDDITNAMIRNAKFKVAVYNAANMPRLAEIIESLMLQVAPLFRYSMGPSAMVASSFKEDSTKYTKRILSGLRTRRGDLVKRAIHGIIDSAIGRTMKYFEEQRRETELRGNRVKRPRGRPRKVPLDVSAANTGTR